MRSAGVIGNTIRALRLYPKYVSFLEQWACLQSAYYPGVSAQLKDVRSKRFFSSLVLAAVATALHQLGIVGDQSRPRGEFIA